MYSLKPKPEGGQPPASTPPPPPPPRSSLPEFGLMMIMSAAIAVAIVGLGFVAYSEKVDNKELKERVRLLETQMDREIALAKDAQKEAAEMASDIDVVTKKVGVTSTEIDRSRKVFAEQLRESQERAKEEQARLAEQQEKSATELSQKIETKASRTEVAADVNAARQEAAVKVADVQRAADTKIGAVSGEVKTVATNLDATRKEVADSRRDLVDVKTSLSQQIAKNSTELADLRKKGERDYFEFDIAKDKKVPMKRVADIQLGLDNADVKNRRYDLTIQVDDSKLKKTDRLVNEPIQFLVGRDKLRYELVVNSVDKDRIKGYLSVPKDKVLSAERPGFRPN